MARIGAEKGSGRSVAGLSVPIRVIRGENFLPRRKAASRAQARGARPARRYGRNEQMYSQRPAFTAMVKPLLAGTSKKVPAP
ncbi:MAG: hypothetical protein RLZZ15_1971 [Verrucomicrobiota bacterium]